jgi:hypothetical protein
VAAVRALRQRGLEPSGAELHAVFAQCLGQLPGDTEDHPLETDVAAAEGLIASWAETESRGLTAPQPLEK